MILLGYPGVRPGPPRLLDLVNNFDFFPSRRIESLIQKAPSNFSKFLE